MNHEDEHRELAARLARLERNDTMNQVEHTIIRWIVATTLAAVIVAAVGLLTR